MSTTSEYYIRNMSMSEFEQYYRRLQSQERKRTRADMKSQLDREINRAMKRASKANEKQRRALQSQLDKLAKEHKAQAECNQRALNGLETRLVELQREGDARAEQVADAISLLKREQTQVAHELSALHTQGAELERSIATVDAKLEAESQAWRARRERAEGYYVELNQMFTERYPELPKTECARFQLTGELRSIERGVSQAREQHRANIEGAAASTIAQCLREADELHHKLESRRDQERAMTLEIKLKREGSRSKLHALNTEEVRRYLATQVDQLSDRLESLARQEAEVEAIQVWDDRRARLRELNAHCSEVDAEITSLYHRYDELIEQSAHRETVLRGFVQALVEVWGGEYEMDAYLEDPNDLSSALIFRTKRGLYAPNVQARIELDGRLEANLTGYQGVECAHDEAQLREALSRRASVEVVRGHHEVIPDAPNPDDSGPAHSAPTPVTVARSATRAETPKWAQRSHGSQR